MHRYTREDDESDESDDDDGSHTAPKDSKTQKQDSKTQKLNRSCSRAVGHRKQRR